MNNRIQAVDMLCNASEEIGLVETINMVVGNNVKVSVPFSKIATDAPIEDIDFSVRASNCLHRSGKKTIGDIVDVINNEDLPKYRNIGKKTISEIKTKLLVYGYYKLTKAEKRIFWNEFLDKNYIKQTSNA